MILAAIVYYIAAASAILFYGIGIGRTLSVRGEYSLAVLSCVKAFSVAAATAALSWLAVRWLLAPAHLYELFPLVAALVFLVMTILVEIFLDVGFRKSPAEFSVTLLSVLLAINESLSVAHAVVIACSCVASFYMLLVMFHAIRDRTSFFFDPSGIRVYPMLLLSLAAVILAVCGAGASWLARL